MAGAVVAMLVGLVVPLSWSVAQGGALKFRMENDDETAEMRSYFAGIEKTIVTPTAKPVSPRIVALLEQEGLAELASALETVPKKCWGMTSGPAHTPHYSVTGDTGMAFEEAKLLVNQLPRRTHPISEGAGFVLFQGRSPKSGLPYLVSWRGSPPGKPKRHWFHFFIQAP